MILAIIQTIPTHPSHVVRTDSFAKFQQICGMIEQTDYLAAHASCHATMNGIERTLACDANILDKDSLLHALNAIFEAGPFDALVIPGLTDFELQKYICSICQTHASDFKFTVFLDAERHEGIENIISHQETVPRFARYAWPWVSTVTPGRRSAIWLPASCLIAPLALGKTKHLRGVHDLAGMRPDDIARLAEHDVELLINKTEQRRPVIGRYQTETPAVRPVKQAFVEVPGVFAKNDEEIPKDPNETVFENDLAEELHRRCDELIKQYAVNGPQLWSALQRTAFAVLNEAKSRGNIINFHVRCDEETASWGTPEKPVVEVLIEYPKRVKEIKFNWK